MSQPAAIPRRLPPPPTPPPPRNETLQVEDLDIEALEDAFSDEDPPELREITQDFITRINEQIRRIRNEDK